MGSDDVTDLTTPQGIARALLAFYRPDGSNWTQGFLAQNAERHATSPDASDAVCFCMWGALKRLTPERAERSAESAMGLPPTIERAAFRLGVELNDSAKLHRIADPGLACVNDAFKTHADLRLHLSKVAEGEV